MPHWLAGLLLLLLGTVAAAATPPVTDRAAAASDLTRTLALLEQVDPQTLPAALRQTLFFAVADALLSDGQQERALDLTAGSRGAHGWASSYNNLAEKYGFYFHVSNGAINTGVHGGSRSLPGAFGARASKLMDYLCEKHYGVRLPDDDLRRY